MLLYICGATRFVKRYFCAASLPNKQSVASSSSFWRLTHPLVICPGDSEMSMILCFEEARYLADHEFFATATF